MSFRTTIFLALALLCLHPWISAGVALLGGVFFALSVENPFPAKTKKWTVPLLQLSVVGLGAGMDLGVVTRVGLEGVGYTAIGITLTFLIGTLLGKTLGIQRSTSVLITAGTAICGGSAIAATAPVIGAGDEEVSVAAATVFLLNAAALVFFPWTGHYFGLSERQFGLWAALAIHDTSSVVGAGLQYGAQALEVAATVKLARALWIIPMTWGLGTLWSRNEPLASEKKSAKKPWFILGFLVAASLVTWIPALRPIGNHVAFAARRSLVLTLFLIGAGLNRSSLRAMGFRPFLQGILLWAIVGSVTLGAIFQGWIH